MEEVGSRVAVLGLFVRRIWFQNSGTRQELKVRFVLEFKKYGHVQSTGCRAGSSEMCSIHGSISRAQRILTGPGPSQKAFDVPR